MRFDKSRCLTCGTPNKPSTHYPVSDFWFCSEQCQINELYKYVPKEFGSGASYLDDPEISEVWENGKNEYLEIAQNAPNVKIEPFLRRTTSFFSLKEDWETRCIAARNEGKEKLHDRIHAEAKAQRTEQAEKDRIVREKEEEKNRIAREKEEERQRKVDAEKREREVEEDKWRPKRFDV